jgi:hypothetical protein
VVQPSTGVGTRPPGGVARVEHQPVPFDGDPDRGRDHSPVRSESSRASVSGSIRPKLAERTTGGMWAAEPAYRTVAREIVEAVTSQKRVLPYWDPHSGGARWPKSHHQQQQRKSC